MTTVTLTPNQIAAWNLRQLRRQAGITQSRLAELMSHHGLSWTVFTVSDAELAFSRGANGRRFSADELALLATIYYVTPAALLLPPTASDLGVDEVRVAVGAIDMGREEYLTQVLLMPGGLRARNFEGQLVGAEATTSGALGSE